MTMTSVTTTAGLAIDRVFTAPGSDAFEGIEFTTRDARIESSTGKAVFEQLDVEVPASWSQQSTNIVASKYFHGLLGTSERESSAKVLISRVVDTIKEAGSAGGYFDSPESEKAFEVELKFLLANQYLAFNSPVWFNVGCAAYEPDSQASNWHWSAGYGIDPAVVHSITGYKHPQCSACFINAVEDSMSSILDLAKTEGMLFKFGSGTGTNLSVIRGSQEHLSGGGMASGPLSFMKGFDAFAGAIKSGGKTRRAAKMVILDSDHPDIEEFIAAKGKEELKAAALIREGFDGNGPDSEAYSSIAYQNANNSVRVTDAFMEAAISGGDWDLKARSDGSIMKTIKAADLLHKIAKETWRCGDPGMQFDSTINKWHTAKASGRINASNPCSEYMFLDNSACNLASLNLVKFLLPNGKFDSQGFTAAARLLTIAQDILVDMSGYPTEKIACNSHDFRPLGIGYANLGALLMNLGIPYDSLDGRSMAAAITSLMGAAATMASVEIASAMPKLAAAASIENDSESGSYPGYSINKESALDVLRMHLDASEHLLDEATTDESRRLAKAATSLWFHSLQGAEIGGMRNAQVTVLAPTGTIGFLMGCDTTGIEPMLSVITYKKLVGGGYMTIANGAVSAGLRRLGYSDAEIDAVMQHIEAQGTIEGAPALLDEHLPVFDGAFASERGSRSIRWEGHVEMMAVTQPFLSGAISKTINLPNSATVDDIAQAYQKAWLSGLKAVAIYRDGSKVAQPLSTSKETTQSLEVAEVTVPNLNGPPVARRHRLQDDRSAVTHKFAFGGHEGYLTVGLYPNGQPGEVFVRMSKEGSTISGLMDSFAMVVSVALQHGVPLDVICGKLAHTRFEPSGWTGNEKMGYAKSVMDYIGRWLQFRFTDPEQFGLFAQVPTPPLQATVAFAAEPAEAKVQPQFGDAPICTVCGSLTKATGTCFTCVDCSSSVGGCS
jgi:ribonucleoside-diphosphate reductase alpha chain